MSLYRKIIYQSVELLEVWKSKYWANMREYWSNVRANTSGILNTKVQTSYAGEAGPASPFAPELNYNMIG
jgi:hypothetical protein